MAMRVVRRDSKGLYVKGNYGDVCRPCGRTVVEEGKKYHVTFAAGQASSCTNIVVGPKKLEMWIDERTLDFNADFKKRSIECGRCGTQVLPERADDHRVTVLLPNGHPLNDGFAYDCTAAHDVRRGVDLYPNGDGPCSMCGAERGSPHVKTVDA